MAINDKTVMEFGQHGKVAYIEAYVLMEYSGNGQMNPIAFTADKDFAEKFLEGTAVWPEDGKGVINILALPMMDIEENENDE